MSAFLSSLFQEYYTLTDRLTQINNLITTYGGTLPALNTGHQILTEIISTTPQVSNSTSTAVTTLPNNEYPKHGSWREKILHGLKHFGKPVTAKELSGYILTAEKSSDVKRLTERTAQYLTFLDDENRIAVDKTNRPFKYSLIA